VHQVVSEVVGVLRPDKLVAAIASGTGEHWTGSWLSLLPFSDHGFEDIEWKIVQVHQASSNCRAVVPGSRLLFERAGALIVHCAAAASS